MNRRKGVRFNRGRITNAPGTPAPPPGPAGPTDPLTFITSVSPLFYLVGDLGITEVDGAGTGVSTWADQSAAVQNATQATPGARPLVQSAALNGHNTVRYDGIDDVMAFAGLNLPAPGTTPTFFLAVVNRLVDTLNATMWAGGASTTMRFFRASATQVRQQNGVNGNLVNMAVANWHRVEALYQNSAVTDYLKVGATSGGTGVATGNADPAAGAFVMGAQSTAAANPCNCEFAMFAAYPAAPTAGELSAFSTWVTAYYGAGVAV